MKRVPRIVVKPKRLTNQVQDALTRFSRMLRKATLPQVAFFIPFRSSTFLLICALNVSAYLLYLEQPVIPDQVRDDTP